MEQTIMILTDFSIDSLYLVKKALDDYEDQSVNILMVHGVDVSSYPSDLLFFSKSVLYSKLVSEEFKEACSVLRNRYSSRINSFRFDFFTGFTNAAFGNFLEGNKVDKIYVAGNFQSRHLSEMSADITGFVRKCKTEKVEVNYVTSEEGPVSGQLARLFQMNA